MDSFQQNVLLCYRGRYQPQVASLAAGLRKRGLSGTYDREILACEDAGSTAEVEWISLSKEDTAGSTTWRAPLKQAIGNSELIVFLVDPHDPTDNLVNEISWVAKAGRHAFYVLDTRADTVSPDAEGFYVSFLIVIQSMALQRWEVPGFDYLLFAHEDPREVDARLDVAVNRIQEYLERIRVHPLPQVRLDTDITISDVENLPVVRARTRLASIQQGLHEQLGLAAPPHDGGSLPRGARIRVHL